MKIFTNLMTVAALLLAVMVIPSTSGLLAQGNTSGYYATVEDEGGEHIMRIAYYDEIPTVGGNILYVQEKELSNANFTAAMIQGEIAENVKRAYLEVEYDFKPKKTTYWFADLFELEKIEGLEWLNTEEVEDMRGMFWGCSKMKNIDISGFNTQNVKHMGDMFNSCKSLTYLNLSNFNTENVEVMMGMFSYCSGLIALDISGFNTAKVQNMGEMFYECTSLKYIFCDENTSLVTTALLQDKNMMFYGCKSLIGVALDDTEVKWDKTNISFNFFSFADEGGYITKKKGENTVLRGVKTIFNYYEEYLDLDGVYIEKIVEFGQDQICEVKICDAKDLLNDAERFELYFDYIGWQSLNIQYGMEELSAEIFVTSDIGNIEVSLPDRNVYEMPITADSLDLTNGAIEVFYNCRGNIYSIRYEMTDQEPIIEGLDNIKPGENALKLSFEFVDTTFVWEYKITVVEGGSGEEGGDEPGTGEGGEGGSEEGGNTEEEPGEDEPEKPVAVEDLNGGGAAFEAWTSRGVLSVKTARAGVLEVLSVNGVLLRRVEVVGGSNVSVALERGVYVLKMGGEVKKVVVE